MIMSCFLLSRILFFFFSFSFSLLFPSFASSGFFLSLLRRHHQDDCRLDLFVVVVLLLLRLLYNNFSSASSSFSTPSINEGIERHVTYTDQAKSQTDRDQIHRDQEGKRQASSVVSCPSTFNTIPIMRCNGASNQSEVSKRSTQICDI